MSDTGGLGPEEEPEAGSQVEVGTESKDGRCLVEGLLEDGSVDVSGFEAGVYAEFEAGSELVVLGRGVLLGPMTEDDYEAEYETEKEAPCGPAQGKKD